MTPTDTELDPDDWTAEHEYPAECERCGGSVTARAGVATCDAGCEGRREIGETPDDEARRLGGDA